MASPEMNDLILWYAQDPRGIIPLDNFHMSRSLKKVIKSKKFAILSDTNFEAVVRECAIKRGSSDETWISEEIIDSYTQLHRLGFAHSVECYEDGKLVGGLYGVCIKGAFFGESMFHKSRDASKVAICALVESMKRHGFALLDTQYTTAHLISLGAIDIPKVEYDALLNEAIQLENAWWNADFSWFKDFF